MDPSLDNLKRIVSAGKLFDIDTNIVALAQESGFVIGNADINDADGFIAVNEEVDHIPGFTSNRVIGVNSKKDLQSKEKFIAQELSFYLKQKEAHKNEKIKFAQRSILKPENNTVLVVPPFEGKMIHVSTGGVGNRDFLTIPIEKQRTVDVDQSMKIPALNNSELVWGSGTDLSALQEDWKSIAKYQFLPSANEKELGKDVFQSDEQYKRDVKITELLLSYVTLYKQRENSKKEYRKVLFFGCTISTFLIIAACIVMLILWLPIIVGQYETPMVTAQEQVDSVVNSADFEQIVENVDALINAATEGTDYGTLAGTIAKMTSVSIGTAAVADASETQADMSVRNVVSLITVCLTLLGSLIALLKIIATYVFPADEEKNMHQLVQAIQDNDYKQRLASIKAANKEPVADLDKPSKPESSNN